RELADDRLMYGSGLVLERLDRLDAGLVQRPPVVRQESSRRLRRKELLIGLAVQLGPWSAEGLLGRIVDVHVAPIHVLDPRQAGQVLHESREALLALAQLVFDLLARGDVFDGDDDPPLDAR